MTTSNPIQPGSLVQIPKIPNEIKELIEIIPEYDGSTGTLPHFISICDEILGIIDKQTLSSIVKRIILHTIRKKIVRDANTKLATKVYTDWVSLRALLVEEYGDKRNEIHFLTELSHFEQKSSEDIFVYFDKYEDIFNRMMSLLKLNFGAGFENLAIFMSSYASHNFIINCKEPYRSQLAARNPRTLTDVQNLIKNDFQYLHSNMNKQIQNKPKINVPTPQYKPNTQNPLQYRYPVHRHPQTNNHPNQSNQFKPKQNYPQPMSISTNSYRPQLKRNREDMHLLENPTEINAEQDIEFCENLDEFQNLEITDETEQSENFPIEPVENTSL